MTSGQTQGGRSAVETADALSPNRRLRGDGAVALVEFAILLPALAIIICGVIDLGRAYHLENQLKNAAREGAIYGQTHPLQQQLPPFPTDPNDPCANLQSIQARAYEELQASGQQPPQDLVVTVTDEDGASTTCNGPPLKFTSGNQMTVSASARFDLITPIIQAIVGSPKTITESVTVEIQ